MTHPCEGHACDGCFCCSRLHVCCLTIPPEVRAWLEAVVRQSAPGEEVCEAIVAEAGRMPGLGELVRAEAGTASGLAELVRLEVGNRGAASLLLRPSMRLSPPEAAEPIPDDYSRKEAVYVHVTRTA